MTSLADRVPTLQTLLTTTAAQSAHDTGCVQRVRVFTGASLVQTLVFGWRDIPAATLGVSITGHEIADRFSSQAVACLA